MITVFKKAVLGTALAATAIAGTLAGPTTASAQAWHRGGYGHSDGAGIAVAAGVVGLIAGAAIASSHDHYYPAPVAYAPPVYPVQPACYNAYPGYDGYCYPSSYYVNLGWGYHDGGWWYGGARYARPYVIGGWHGGYVGGGYVRGGYVRGGYVGGGYRGFGGGWHGGWHGGR